MTILQETENNCSSKENEVVESQEENKNSNCKDNTELLLKNASTTSTSKDHSTEGQAQDENVNNNFDSENCIVRPGLQKEIAKQVLRKKLAKLRHLVLSEAISPAYLDSLFPDLLKHFDPQKVTYNGGIANIKEWKISCYLEVMEGGVPTANPNMELLNLFHPLLDECNNLFLYWYRQKSACNNSKSSSLAKKEIKCSRLMTFITRYTPAPGEQALLKVRDERIADLSSFQEWVCGLAAEPPSLFKMLQASHFLYFLCIHSTWMDREK